MHEAFMESFLTENQLMKVHVEVLTHNTHYVQQNICEDFWV